MKIRIRTSRWWSAAVGAAVAAAGPSALAAPAADVEVYGVESPAHDVLPTQGMDLPADGSSAGGSRAFALSPQVQAIPTPTGFQGGVTLLVIGTTAGLLAKRRRRRMLPLGR